MIIVCYRLIKAFVDDISSRSDWSDYCCSVILSSLLILFVIVMVVLIL